MVTLKGSWETVINGFLCGNVPHLWNASMRVPAGDEAAKNTRACRLLGAMRGAGLR